MSLVLTGLTKDFRDVRAVDNLSIEIKRGSIFGFLGPNGAGKTTTIRMILSIIKPDSGRVSWCGEPWGSNMRGRYGYLPEERGLYPKMRTEEHLIFLARINGLEKRQAVKRVGEWIERFQLGEYRHKRIEELSKGNQQKVQTIATMIHEPELLFLDEPFSGLDPVNTAILKEIIVEGNRKGQTVVFSSHRMDQVEELCEDICIINKGKLVLDGNLREIKRAMGRQILRISLEGDTNLLNQIRGLRLVGTRHDFHEFKIEPGVDTNEILSTVQQAGKVIRFELVEPSLEQIFVTKVGENQ
ncbi:MAG: ATP-binding cassette domain-containing protein [Firmicutes bacterium]|nr:ATP-binding cassette domain-containing protein [Bacillota bacterium]